MVRTLSASEDESKITKKQFSMEEKWQQVAEDVISSESTSMSDKGSLVVVGSGIMCVAHFTLETLSHIDDADKVFYLVADPATEVSLI